MKKKILFLTHVGSPGGAEYKMLNLCSSDDYVSEVIHFQKGILENILKERCIKSTVIEMNKKIESFKKDDGIIKTLKSIPSALSLVRSLSAESKKHDVIVCFSQKAFIMASLSKPFTRKPIIWFMNDILSPQYFSRFIIFILKNISRLTADHIVLNSKESLRKWKEYGGRKKRVSVIYSGIDINDFLSKMEKCDIQAIRSQYSPNKNPLVGIFGRVSPWKGQDVFLKAIEKLKNTNAIIVGDALFGEQEYKDKIMELTKSLKIADRVTFTGHIENVPSVMTACDVICHCSTLPEPFGRVIVEANIAGTPVIATDAGGTSEIVQHNETGQLTPMGDVDTLVEAINKYLDNPQWAQEVAKKGKMYSQEHFSVEKMNKEFQKILQNLLY